MRRDVGQRRLQCLQETRRATVGWRWRTLRVGIDVDNPPINFPKRGTFSYHLDCGRKWFVVDNAPVQERRLAWINTGARILPKVGSHESRSVWPTQLSALEHAIKVAQLCGRKHTGKRRGGTRRQAQSGGMGIVEIRHRTSVPPMAKTERPEKTLLAFVDFCGGVDFEAARISKDVGHG